VTRRDLEAALRRFRSADPLARSAHRTALDLGVPLWIVGGLVRDTALGRRSRDLDLVAGKGAAKLVRGLREVWGTRGHRFHKRGVTTWRFQAAGREIDVVDAGRRGLDDDLRRREFTVNAIAFDLASGRIVDPLDGLRDLRRGVLRMPRPGVFREDPLRTLRAARFLAQLPDFRIGSESAEEAKTVAPRLRRAAVERVRDELDRLLVATDPARGLRTAMDLGVVRAVLPELLPMSGCLAGRDRPDVWDHTLGTLTAAAGYRRRPAAALVRDPATARVLRWSLLLHDVAKPDTLVIDDDGRPTFHGHEVLGSGRAGEILRRLLLPKNVRTRVRRLIRFHLRPYQLAECGMPVRGMRRLAREAGEDLPTLIVHAACDGLGSGAPDARARWRKLRAACNALLETWEAAGRETPAPLLGGDDVMRVLGLDPGPEVGAILAEVRDLQESGTIRTRREALAALSERAKRPERA
jgi:tRNA nucleotidyltransferase/poly(A) polymerase